MSSNLYFFTCIFCFKVEQSGYLDDAFVNLPPAIQVAAALAGPERISIQGRVGVAVLAA